MIKIVSCDVQNTLLYLGVDFIDIMFTPTI